MTLHPARQLPAALLLSLGLAACGGGGETDPSAATRPPTNTDFPLAAAYQTYLAQPSAKTYSVSGDCQGTATISKSAPVETVFEAKKALAITTEENLDLPGCTALGGRTRLTSVEYYDTDYTPLGALSAMGITTVYLQTTKLPATIRVDSTGSGPSGAVGFFDIKPGSAPTVAVNGAVSYAPYYAGDPYSIRVNFNVTRAGPPLSHITYYLQTSRFRFEADGRLNLLSIDRSASLPFFANLTYTAQ